jgi:hypothetical protein
MTLLPRPECAANPFATRRVRPGAIPYFFSGVEDAARVVERLRAHGWWGQIVGPHGSGKSTLLAALLPELRCAGRAPLLIALHDGQRRLLPEARAALDVLPGGAAVVILDGYEQLSRWSRFGLRHHCRRREQGLLVTAHQSVGFPELFRTGVTPETAQKVMNHLLPDAKGVVAGLDVVARLAAWAGNLREVLFELYDLYESQRRQTPWKLSLRPPS